jgi:lipopolysaccharide heptosyltransferase II
MATNWDECKNILCIRPDNMGDLIMSGPAMRAIKESFGAKITVLTSSMAAGVARHMSEIDEIMVYDLPWVKTETAADAATFNLLIEQLKERQFDAAIIFTVYSQNPLPTVMLAYLAGIPKRLAYCRENPYQLLTDWVPDKEPYSVIKHQVTRDLELVATVGAHTQNDKLILQTDVKLEPVIKNRLLQDGIDLNKKWIILHPGVSEVKREYPEQNWIDAGKKIVAELGYQLVITGSVSEKKITERLQKGIGKGSYNAGGLFNLDEFITLVKMAPVIVSVNTGTIHIAAATGTPVVVLYALTNPQHTPWKVPNRVLPFQIPPAMHSKNELIRHVNAFFYREPIEMPNEAAVFNAVNELLNASPYDDNQIIQVNLAGYSASPPPDQTLTENQAAVTN